MNRKTLIRLGRENGWKGNDLESFKSWAIDEGIETMKVGGETVNLDQIEKVWAKTVTVSISADAGEDVVVEDASAMTEEMDEELDEKMSDEDEAAEKSVKSAKVKRSQDNVRAWRKASSPASGGGFSATDAAKKAYDRAIKSGERLTRTGARPLFLDADRSEYFGAKARLVAMSGRDYPQRDADEKIAQKTGLTSQNSTGGALVFYEELPELIENLEQNGAARRAIGVTNMRDGEQTVSKISGDVTMYDIGEGDAITASDPTYGNVKLVAAKTAALVRQSSELLNDTAFNIGDVLARSINRAVGTWEDESVFLGSHNRQGVNDLVGANTSFDAALSASWSEFTISDIQDTLGKLPAWAFDDPNFGIVCSLPFYHSVLRRFALSAGGNTGTDVLGGFGESLMWDGIPVYISQVMPKVYAGNANVMFVGAWSRSAKFGVVSGSEQMATSDQRYFDQDQVAFRYTQRWAHTLHDVNNTANASGVVALID